MRHAAQVLAAQGRYGDSMLLHVSPQEVQGIASLIPGGLTTNPHTGLPEAFFFLPFLASLFGAAAPAAAAATTALTAGTAAAAAAPALAAGTAAAGTAAAGAAGAAGTGNMGTLAHGLGAIPGAIAHGIGSLGTLGATAPVAAAAPVATAAGNTLANAALTSGVNTGIAATSPLLPVAHAGTQGASLAPGIGVPAAAPAVAAPVAAPAGLANVPVPIPRPIGLGQPPIPGIQATQAGAQAAANAVRPAATPLLHPGQSLTSVPSTAVKAEAKAPKGGLGSLLTMKNLPMLSLGASALSNLFSHSKKGDGEDDDKKDAGKQKYSGGDPVFPEAGYNAGRYEHNYFPNYQYANGGIVALANGGMVDPQQQQPQDQSFPQNGVPGNAGMTDEAPTLEDIPSSPYPTAQIGTAPEPSSDQLASADQTAAPSTANEHELIAQTVEAIQGKIPKHEAGPILMAFVNEFGERALQDLAQRVKAMPPGGAQPGAQPGPGDGQSDSVPAMIDGQQPAALSQGEYVVPADVVSHLGNGSTDAGAQHLDGMVGNVRQQRTGNPQQPPAMNAGGLVNGYAQGGIVSASKFYKPQFPDDPVLSEYEIGPKTGGFLNVRNHDNAISFRDSLSPDQIDNKLRQIRDAAKAHKHAAGGIVAL
jgi:hypothetical protein